MPKPPITARPHVFFIRPAPGWLELLFEEVSYLAETPLQKYKFEPNVTMLKGAVKLHRCDFRQGLDILLRLTTAHDMEWVIDESKCTSWSELEAILERMPWLEILPPQSEPVHVTTDVFNAFTSSFGKIRDKFCEAAKVEHVAEGATFRFKLELRVDRLRISLSLAGEPLYKRGYKASYSTVAPLPEHHASAGAHWVMAALEEDESVGTVFVPFAGSGTFGFEALLILLGSGPGAFSRQFACDRFPVTPTATMGFLRRKLTERLNAPSTVRVVLNDFNDKAIASLKENVAAFAHSENFEVLEGDVFEVKPKFSDDGKILVLLNPPYGDRLASDSEIPELYARLGAYLKNLRKAYPDRVLGGCLCPDEPTWRAFLKELSVPEAETHHFTHGGKEMRFVRFH